MRKLYAFVILILISSCTKVQFGTRHVDAAGDSPNPSNPIAWTDGDYMYTDAQTVEAVNAAGTAPVEEVNYSSFTGESPKAMPGASFQRIPVDSPKPAPPSTEPAVQEGKRQAEKTKRAAAIAQYRALWKKRAEEPKSNGTNGLAIAAFVVSLVGIPFLAINGIFTLLAGVLAIVFGAIARSQLKQSGNTQKGKGLALAGFIIGIVETGLVLLFVLIALAILASWAA